MFIRKYILLVLSPGLALSFEHQNFHLINDARCGLHSPGQRIHNGREASLGEFPWMVYVETHKIYHNGTDGYCACGGSILNEKYILSASHCFVDGDTELASMDYKLIVGEYDMTRNPDCVDNVCAPGVVVYEPEQVINHPNYVKILTGWDISLIRVRGVINFNEFVAPICLEDGDLLRHDYAGERGVAAGWGGYAFADPKREHLILANVLQTLSVPILDDRSCKNTALEISFRNLVIESLVCAGGDVEQFVYKGDSGGPLMVVKQIDPNNVPRFYQIGVVSGGAVAKASPFHLPVVYTRVRFYLPWILDNMRP